MKLKAGKMKAGEQAELYWIMYGISMAQEEMKGRKGVAKDFEEREIQ